MLTIAVSSRSLFHIEDGNEIFEKQGQAAFDAYMREKENVPLRPGSAFPLVRKLLNLNKLRDKGARPLVQVIMLSRNSPEAGLRAMNSVQHYGLGIEMAVFSRGGDRFKYAKAMGAHLFLSANAGDVKTSLDRGLAAATLRPTEREDSDSDDEVRIAFDGDSVLFSDEADQKYRNEGLTAFRDHEVANASIPLGAGPFKRFLEELTLLQQVLPAEHPNLRVALVTARGMPAHARPVHTLRHWGVHVDEALFAAGAPKGALLEAFGADIFFDDTAKNITSAVEFNVPSGHVPFGAGGIVAPELESSTVSA